MISWHFFTLLPIQEGLSDLIKGLVSWERANQSWTTHLDTSMLLWQVVVKVTHDSMTESSCPWYVQLSQTQCYFFALWFIWKICLLPHNSIAQELQPLCVFRAAIQQLVNQDSQLPSKYSCTLTLSRSSEEEKPPWDGEWDWLRQASVAYEDLPRALEYFIVELCFALNHTT